MLGNHQISGLAPAINVHWKQHPPWDSALAWHPLFASLFSLNVKDSLLTQMWPDLCLRATFTSHRPRIFPHSRSTAMQPPLRAPTEPCAAPAVPGASAQAGHRPRYSPARRTSHPHTPQCRVPSGICITPVFPLGPALGMQHRWMHCCSLRPTSQSHLPTLSSL